MRLTGKRLLVTGAAGFIGSNLCEFLLEAGNTVTGTDNFITGKHENISSFKEHPLFNFREGDARNLDFCREITADIDIVFHQAAVGSVPRSIENPIVTNDNNINGFLNMIVAAKDSGVKRFVFASSSSIYGDSQELPKVEERIGNPLSPYAITKYVNELYARNFSSLFGIETIGLRYFNVFGKRQDPKGAYAAAIPRFIRMLAQKESPVINGDGLQTRDFTYIDNVLLANELAALASDPSALNTTYNVAYGESVSVNKLVETLRDLLMEYDPEIGKVPFTYGPFRKGDVQNSLASIEKAKTLLNYTPPVDVYEGLKRTVKYYMEQGL